jgi:DMSO/TMAO reductase YedYZ molybdopterin-dependent catalytic subunit
MPRQTISLPAADGSKTVYEGVLLREILQKAGVPSGGKLRGKALTTYVLATARDGYQVAFTLGELDPQFGNETILVADTRDGKPLPEKQGPFRLVCPNEKEGARSVRMLETLHVVQLSK